MSHLLYRLGRWSATHRVRVLGAWLALLVLAVATFAAFGGEVNDSFSLPGTESQAAADLLAERFPEAAGSSTVVVISGDDLATAQSEELRSLAAELRALDGVSAVTDPLGPGAVSPDGSVARMEVRFPAEARAVEEATFEHVLSTVDDARSEALQVEVGGEVAAVMAAEEPGGTSEVIGLGVAVLVLLFAFGSVVAMGLPLTTALVGVGISMATLLTLASFVDIPTVAEVLGVMIGLAVGIDYALFIVSRHRDQLREGVEVVESVARALATAGGAVVFAGSTVVIAMAGLLLVGIPFVAVMALSVSFAVVMAVAIAITLLPALLGFAGDRVARVTIPGLRNRPEVDPRERMGARWSRWVTRRPWVSFTGGLVVIAVLAAPLLSLETAMPSDGSAPEESSRRNAYELLEAGFGPGANAPLLVVVDHADTEPQDAARVVAEVRQALAATDGIVAVTPPVPNAAGDATVLRAVPTAGPTDAETIELIDRLRETTLPLVEERSGVTTYVAGPTAVNVDIDAQLTERLPWVVAVVIGLTFVVLMLAFRSVLVPLKAAIGILLSIGAALGVVVAVFQWGWGASLIGVDTAQPIVSFLPVVSFAILFGLSMDYEVFILSRVREEWLRTDDAHESVVNGVAMTARVITAAAAIMISVFGGFMLGDDPTVKMVGLGLATAVLIDATIVRMILVPSTMVMFDRANWWLPAWLDRILPHVDVEGEGLMADLEGGVGQGGATVLAPDAVPAAAPAS